MLILLTGPYSSGSDLIEKYRIAGDVATKGEILREDGIGNRSFVA